MAKKKKKRMSKKKRFKALLVIELLLLIVVIAGAVGATVFQNYAKKIKRDSDFDEDKVLNNTTGDGKYTNIAVFGLDSRTNNLERALSDMIMIVSINNETKKVKVVSVYRDTWLLSGEEGSKTFRKATEAYNQGGGEWSVRMLNENFDLDITDYVAVNFDAVYSAVDAVGGVDIDISSKEQSDINRYIDELNEINGTNSPHINKTGVLHLDGIQATAYGRIREIDTDFARTERQREVMMELFKSVRGSSVSQLKKLVDTLAPKILTTLSNSEILDMALDVASYDIVDTTGFPFEFVADFHPVLLATKGKKNSIVMPDNLALSAKQLHRHLFDDEDYEPSERVKEISAMLDDELGRQENTKTTMYDKEESEDEESADSVTKAGEKASSKKKSGE